MASSEEIREILEDFIGWLGNGNNYEFCIVQPVEENCKDCATHKHKHECDFSAELSNYDYIAGGAGDSEMAILEYMIKELHDNKSLKEIQNKYGIYVNHYIEDGKLKIKEAIKSNKKKK